MLASSVNAGLCALVAVAYWSFLGFAVARCLFPRALAIGAAPVIGWAVHNAVALPVLMLVGFSSTTVVRVAVLGMIGGCALIFTRRGTDDTEAGTLIPAWAYAAAALLALGPTAAIVPKMTADGVQFAGPIFDHSKVAIIDAMTRLALPPVNPFFGEFGAPGRLAYYYLWYFSAAQLALSLDVSGWEADIGQTWFSAFSSLTLMMGLAVWLSARKSAVIWVVLFAGAASLRTTLGLVFGDALLYAWLAPPIGFAGWLFQAAWVPQHLMSASCVVVAILLLGRFAHQQRLMLLATFVLVLVAGFESSTYVGGVTFALAALAAMPILLIQTAPPRRLRVALGIVAAAVLAGGLASPLILDQIASVGLRDAGAPIIVRHFEVLGDAFPQPFGRLLDLPAYWLVLLPIEFPAAFIAGSISLAAMLRARARVGEGMPAKVAIASLVAASLAASWLLVSTLGDVNDLGLRAVLPGALILIASASAGVATRLHSGRIGTAAIAVCGLALSLPESAQLIYGNAVGNPAAGAKVFAQTPAMWEAVRAHAEPGQRVANNPLFLRDMTPWPVNISWALLANRSSCFAGRELVLAYVPLPRERREAINAQFIRVFEGEGTPDDIADMATKYACEVVVVTAEDKAWANDPFAASVSYRLVESREGAWRLYKLNPGLVPTDRGALRSR